MGLGIIDIVVLTILV